MDVDGDGTVELLTRYEPHDTDRITTYFERGWYALRYASSPPQLRWERVEFPDVGSSATGHGMQGVDLNGDGLMDIGAQVMRRATRMWSWQRFGSIVARASLPVPPTAECRPG